MTALSIPWAVAERARSAAAAREAESMVTHANQRKTHLLGRGTGAEPKSRGGCVVKRTKRGGEDLGTNGRRLGCSKESLHLQQRVQALRHLYQGTITRVAQHVESQVLVARVVAGVPNREHGKYENL